MVIVHGEVRPELQRAADAVLSTSQMIKYVEAHPEKQRFAILTECGLVVRMELEHPEKQFYKPCRLCQYMKATTLENVYETLRDEPADRLITVPADVRDGRGARDAQDDRARELRNRREHREAQRTRAAPPDLRRDRDWVSSDPTDPARPYPPPDPASVSDSALSL